MSETPSNAKLSFAEENNAEILNIQKQDEQDRQQAGAKFQSDEKKAAADQRAALGEAGLLPPSEETLVRQAEESAVRAIAAKKTQDANGTWSITKAAAAAHKPEKPYVAAARATETAARAASQPTQSMGLKAR